MFMYYLYAFELSATRKKLKATFLRIHVFKISNRVTTEDHAYQSNQSTLELSTGQIISQSQLKIKKLLGSTVITMQWIHEGLREDVVVL